MSLPQTSPRPSPHRAASTVTVVSCLTSSSALSDGERTSSSAPHATFCPPSTGKTPTRFVLTVELDSASASALTKLTVEQLRRTVERVLLPRNRQAPPYVLTWSVSLHNEARQPPSTSAATVQRFTAAGDGVVRSSRAPSHSARALPSRHDGDDGGLPESTCQIPAGVTINVFANEDSAIRANTAVTATTAREDPARAETASSPNRAAKSVAFIFDEAVVRAQEPAVLSPAHRLPTPARIGRTASPAAPSMPAPSSRLPLRQTAVAAPVPAVPPARVRCSVAVDTSVASAPRSAQPTSPPSPLSSPSSQVASGRGARRTDGGHLEAPTERFHRTTTPSPLRPEASGTAAQHSEACEQHVHLTADPPLVAVPAPAVAVTHVPVLSRRSLSMTSSSAASSSWAYSSPREQSQPRNSLTPPSPSSTSSPSSSSERMHVAAPTGTGSGVIVDQTLPYAETSVTMETATTTPTMTTRSTAGSHDDGAQAAASERPILRTSVSSSRSASSPAFGSFRFSADRSPSVRSTHDRATGTSPVAGKDQLDVAASSARRAPSDGSTARATAPERLVTPMTTTSTGVELAGLRAHNASWLLSPLPIDVDEEDEEDVRTGSAARLSPPAHHTAGAAARWSHTSTRGGHEARELRFSESPPPPVPSSRLLGSAAPPTAATSPGHDALDECERDDGARTTRDVVRAAERLLSQYSAFLPSNTTTATTPVRSAGDSNETCQWTASATTTTKDKTPPPASPAPPSPALLAQLGELAALTRQHQQLLAQQLAQRKRFTAATAHRVGRHEGQMRDLASYVAAQTEAWQSRLTRAQRRSRDLVREAARLASHEAATAAQLTQLQKRFASTRDTLVALRDDLANLPNVVTRSTGLTRTSRATSRAATSLTTPAAPPPSRAEQRQLAALASALVSETAYKHDDVAYLAALSYRGAQQVAALRALEKGQRRDRDARAAESSGSSALVAVPVCRPPLCIAPPPASSVTAWLGSKPHAYQTAFARVLDFYTRQASPREKLTMDVDYGVVASETAAVPTHTVHLYDPRRQRHRRGNKTPTHAPWTSMSFPRVYNLPDGAAPRAVAGHAEAADVDTASSMAGLATSLSGMFEEEVEPLLGALMHRGAHSQPSRATILLYGAAGSGKTTCLFGLSQLSDGTTTARSTNPTAPSSQNQDDDGDDRTLHFSLSSVGGAVAKDSPELSLVDGDASSDKVSDFVFESTASHAASKKHGDGTATVLSSLPSQGSLRFQEVASASQDLPVGLTPVAVEGRGAATEATSTGVPEPARAVPASKAVVHTCGWCEAEGLLPRTLAWLLAQPRTPGQMYVQRIELSAVEVYYDHAYDLLDDPLPPPSPTAAAQVVRVNGKGVAEVIPAWDFGLPSLPASRRTHPSRLRPLSLLRTRRTSSQPARRGGAHRSRGGDEGVERHNGAPLDLDDPLTATSAPHPTVWFTRARWVTVSSPEEACHWLRVITDHRCTSPAPPLATDDAVDPTQKARTTAPGGNPTLRKCASEAPPSPPSSLYSGHVLVSVRVAVALAAPAAKAKSGATDHADGGVLGTPSLVTLSHLTTTQTSTPSVALPATALRTALDMPCQATAGTPPPPRSRSTAQSPGAKTPASPSHTFQITFADLAGSSRHDAFTRLPQTRAARDGALCVRRQLAALRDVLAAVATASGEGEVPRTPSAAHSSGIGAGTNAAPSAPQTRPERPAASWDPLCEWPAAVPKLGETVHLTVRTPPTVVKGCPLPFGTATSTPSRAPHVRGDGLDLVELSSLTDGTADPAPDASFRRALRPWLPRDGEDEDERVDEPATPPLSPPDVPSHVRIPYHRSLLTQLLQPTLGPGPACRTLAFICVKPCSVLECLPEAVTVLQEKRKQARLHRAPPPSIDEETLLATAQSALARSAPLRLSEAYASLTLAQRLNQPRHH